MSLTFDHNLVIAAGAGTGKTHTLVELAVGLYCERQLDPGRVWLVTFTDRAAGELRARLLARVRQTTRGTELSAALRGAPIGTFHALSARLLRAHGLAAAVDPGFVVLPEPQGAELRARLLEDVFAGDPSGAVARLTRRLGGLWAVRAAALDLHAQLAEEGRRAADLAACDPGAALKERALAAHPLIEACQGLARALERLAVAGHPRLAAPVEAAWRERERLRSCPPESLAAWYPAALAVAEAPVGPGRAGEPLRQAYRDAFARVQDAFATRAASDVAADLALLLGQHEARYAAEKRRRRALDFGDLLRQARDLLRDHPLVRESVKAEIDAVLVDEAQDTNAVQLELVHLLAESRGGHGELEPAALCLVGDHKQAIYDFRGADVSLFEQLCERARQGDGLRLATLRRSFRCGPDLVSFVNQAAAGFLPTWRPDEDPLAAERTTPGIVELLEDESDDRAAEAELVARHVADLLAVYRGSDVAILLRAFSTSLDAYRSALAERGIPSLVLRGSGFHAAPEVRDAVALLTLLCDPHDALAAATVLRSPLGGLSDQALLRLAESSRASGAHWLDPALFDDPRQAEAVKRVAQVVAELGPVVDRLGPGPTLRRALDALDAFALAAGTLQGEQRVANLHQLLQQLDAVTDRAALTEAQGRARRAAADPQAPALVPPSDPRAVRILTVHAAKGLEFPVVVVPELGAREPAHNAPVLFDRQLGLGVRPVDPMGRRISSPGARRVAEALRARREAELRRLLYVALTRARDRLVLCGGRRGAARSWRELLEPALAAVPRVIPSPAVRQAPAPAPAPGLSPASATQLPQESPTKVATGSAVRGSATSGAGAGAGAAFGWARADQIAGSGLPPALSDPLSPTLARATRPRAASEHLVCAVTELAELQVCARRYFYRFVAGLDEHAAVKGGDRPSPGELDRLARGTLAHALLERLDLTLARQHQEHPDHAVVAAARALGHDLAEPELRAIAADVSAFLATPLGRELCAADTPMVQRELPVALAVEPSPSLRLTLAGKIDLLLVDRNGVATVIDYKHASRRHAPAAYQLQLATYALAASRVLTAEVPVEAGVAWLRDRGAPVERHRYAESELASHAHQLEGLAEQLAAARRDQSWPKLEGPDRCGSCGYATRCWRKA